MPHLRAVLVVLGHRTLAATQPADAAATAEIKVLSNENKVLNDAITGMRKKLSSVEVSMARVSYETASLSSEAAAANTTPSSDRRSSLLEEGPGGSQDSRTPIQPQRLVTLTTPDTGVAIDAGANATATAALIAAAGVQA